MTGQTSIERHQPAAGVHETDWAWDLLRGPDRARPRMGGRSTQGFDMTEREWIEEENVEGQSLDRAEHG